MSTCLSHTDLEEYVAGDVSESQAASFHGHLSGCQTCRQALEDVRHDQTLADDIRLAFEDRGDTPPTPETEGLVPSTSTPAHAPRIKDYRIVGVLGQGGMGIVYRAVQTRLNRTVALKVLPAVVGSASPAAVARFRREATSAARLHHTNIIPIYDFGESTDAYYCAMELVEGQPLDEAIRQFREADASNASPARLTEILRSIAPESNEFQIAATDGESRTGDTASRGRASTRGRIYSHQVAKWMADAADALHYAHGEGIVHRDVKPSNLILSVDGRIMIADFGLAKDVNEQSVTVTGSLLGTLRYMSPEQAMAKRVRLDHRTDVYSLGATMYELLTLEPAFPGMDDKEVLGAIITRDPVPPRKINPRVPRELDTICMKTMEKSPDARYDTAREMAEDLRRYINDLPIVAKPPGPIARTTKFVRRHKALVIAGLSFVVISTMVFSLVRATKHAREAELASLVEEGRRLAAAGSYQAAIETYDRALVIDPNSTRALGRASIALKELYNSAPIGARDPALLERAIAAYLDPAMRVEGDRAWSYTTKGVLLKMLGRYDEARGAYEKALALDPENAAAWINWGVIHAMTHDIQTAEEALNKATRLAVRPDARRDAWRNLASVQLFKRDDRALRSIENAINADRTDPPSHVIRARIHLMLPGAIDAERALRSAIHADELAEGRNAKAKRILALALLRDGRPQSAIREAEAALTLQDSAVVNHLVAAIAAAQLMDDVKARYHAQEAQRARSDESADTDHDSFMVTADRGVLWFDAASDLKDLLRESKAMIVEKTPANDD